MCFGVKLETKNSAHFPAIFDFYMGQVLPSRVSIPTDPSECLLLPFTRASSPLPCLYLRTPIPMFAFCGVNALLIAPGRPRVGDLCVVFVQGHGGPGEIQDDHNGVLPRCNGLHSHVRHHE